MNYQAVLWYKSVITVTKLFLLQQPVDGFALSPTGEEIPVKMWECDTVTQAKEKILDAIYKVSHISHCLYTEYIIVSTSIH